MKNFFLLFWLFFSPAVWAQSLTDSLEKVLATPNLHDTVQIAIMTDLAYEYLYAQPQKSIDYCQKVQEKIKKQGKKKAESSIVNLMGGGYWVKGDLDKALACFQNSLQLAYEAQDTLLQAKNIGNIGLIYSGAGNKQLAKINYQKGLHIYEKLKKNDRIAISLANIGVVHLELGEYDSANYYFLKAEPLYEKYRKRDLQTLYINLADLAFRQKDFGKTKEMLIKCQKKAEEQDDSQTLAYVYFFGADLDLERKQIDSAKIKAEKAVQLALKSESKETIFKAYKILSKVMYATQNYKESYKYYDLHVIYRDSVASELAKNALQLFEYERKNGEIASLKAQQLETEILHHEENTKKNIIILVIIFVLALLAGITFFILRGRRKLAKAYDKLSAANEQILQNNEEINQQKEEILQTLQVVEAQRNEIDRHNHNILASIHYAQRIQNALLPQKQTIQESISNFFLFFQPKDIVSGDFYWYSTIMASDQEGMNSESPSLLTTDHLPLITFLVVADCTGHGVSGAFMTIIGNNLLDQIVNKDKIHSPAQILQALDSRLLQTLQQQNVQNLKVNDGMDISILAFQPAENGLKLCWASAKRPLWIFEKGKPEPTEYKGNKFPIGGSQYENKVFTEQEIWVEKGSVIYSFTDGYADQFGKNGKFTIKKFRQLLQEIHLKNLEEQSQILKQNFEAWRGVEKQTDDILIIGIRV